MWYNNMCLALRTKLYAPNATFSVIYAYTVKVKFLRVIHFAEAAVTHTAEIFA